MFRKKKSLNNLSVTELEQMLRIKQREARRERFSRLSANGVSANQALVGQEATVPTTVTPATMNVMPIGSNTGLMTTPQPLGLKQPDSPFPTPITEKTVPKKKFRDRLLLLVELGAVIGLVVVLVGSYLNLKTLNIEAAEVQQQRLNTVPVESLAAVDVAPQAQSETLAAATLPFDRLPGGHSSPTSAEGAVPDIPAHLQSWVQPSPAIKIPTQNAAVATRIVIPKINVDAPIIQGVTWEDLKKGVGHLPGSAQPGERGNLYLAAHNDIFGEIFRYLDELEPGDDYYIYAGEAKYHYQVREKRIIEPTEVGVMLPTTEPVATLQTCYPYLIDTHRLVVVGDLLE